MSSSTSSAAMGLRPAEARGLCWNRANLDEATIRVDAQMNRDNDLAIKPATPRLNGNVERSHRIDAEQFYRLLDGQLIDDADVFNQRLEEWENYYNFERPHGGLNGKTSTSDYYRKQQNEALL